MISVVMPSKATCDLLVRMTQHAVASARFCGIDDIVVLEGCDGVSYKGARTIKNNDTPFCYNRALNRGIAEAKHDYIALSNNDLYFYSGFERIAQIMKKENILSASPFCLSQPMPVKAGERIVEGYRIGVELLGFCIVIHRSVIDRIGGKISEDVDFWYSDNLYADQLKAAKIMHSLICNVFIDHYESITLQNEDYGKYLKLTRDQHNVYTKARNRLNT